MQDRTPGAEEHLRRTEKMSDLKNKPATVFAPLVAATPAIAAGAASVLLALAAAQVIKIGPASTGLIASLLLVLLVNAARTQARAAARQTRALAELRESEEKRGGLVAEQRLAKQALQESRHFAQRITEVCPAVIYVFNVVEQSNTYINRRVAAVLGYTPDELKTLDPQFRMHPEDTARFATHMLQVQQLADGEIAEFEYRMLHHDGTWRWFLSSDGAFTRNAAGAVTHVIGVALDVTERKRAQEEIEEATSLLEALYAQAPIGLVHFDRDMRVVRINEVFAEINGLPVDAHLGRHLLEVQPGPLGQRAAAMIRDVIDGLRAISGVELSGETRAQPGKLRRWKCSFYPVVCPRGRVLGVGSTIEDITERKQLEQTLVESQDRLHKIVSFSPNVAIETFDRDGRVLSWNTAAERIFGYSEQEALGQTLDELILDAPSARSFEHSLREMEQSSQPMGPSEFDVRRKDGTCGTTLSTIFPITTAAGVIFACMDVDISDLRRAQLEKEQLVQELRDAVKARDDFLSVASHELRTPLTPLLLEIESLIATLKRLPPDEMHHKALDKAERVVRHTTRLRDLVERLLDVSRLAEGQLTLDLEELDLSEVCREAIERFSLQAARAGSPLRLETHGTVRGRWDRLRIDQVLTNLLSNALKFGKGKPIDIRLKGDGAVVRIEVQDYGIGMGSRDHERVFGRFERAVSPRQYGGLGLGLYITRHIVEAHGGCISVKSAPDMGATLIVALPREPPRARS